MNNGQTISTGTDEPDPKRMNNGQTIDPKQMNNGQTIGTGTDEPKRERNKTKIAQNRTKSALFGTKLAE